MTTETGAFFIEHKPTKRVRGWPTKSQKPYSVYQGDKYCASFVTRAKAAEYVAKQI